MSLNSYSKVLIYDNGFILQNIHINSVIVGQRLLLTRTNMHIYRYNVPQLKCRFRFFFFMYVYLLNLKINRWITCCCFWKPKKLGGPWVSIWSGGLEMILCYPSWWWVVEFAHICEKTSRRKGLVSRSRSRKRSETPSHQSLRGDMTSRPWGKAQKRSIREIDESPIGERNHSGNNSFQRQNKPSKIGMAPSPSL